VETGKNEILGKLFNLLFACSHKRISRPITPAKHSVGPRDTYVVCFECGKHLAYDLKTMRLGKELK
jgi:hypothetical protein